MAQNQLFISGGLHTGFFEKHNKFSDANSFTLKPGYQAGFVFQSQLPKNNLVFSSSLLLHNIPFHGRLHSLYNVTFFNKHNPHFLQFNSSIGYNKKLSQRISLLTKLGPYINYGLFGKTKTSGTHSYPDMSISYLNREVLYGDNYDDDLKKTNWGLLLEGALTIKNKWQPFVAYNHGLSNIRPEVTIIDDRLFIRSIVVGIRYNMLQKK